ncbi:MAG TPA: NnrU family protein [Vicinamibacterales bacterium]|nr:NnrU family protein [Vicinamibacterales bacterium]
MKRFFTPRLRRVFAIGGALAFAASLLFGAWLYGTAFGGPLPGSISPRAVAVDVALFAAFAIHHSVFARPGLKERVRIRVGTDIERSIYVWIASVLFFLMMACWQPVAGTLWGANAAVAWLLAALQLCGAGLMVVAVRKTDFRGLAGLSALGDSPRPQPDGPISQGPYGLIRHPLYLAFLLLLWPVAVMTFTRLLLAVLFTIYVVLAIPLEERDLRRAFGRGYDDYARRVRSRLLPGVY